MYTFNIVQYERLELFFIIYYQVRPIVVANIPVPAALMNHERCPDLHLLDL